MSAMEPSKIVGLCLLMTESSSRGRRERQKKINSVGQHHLPYTNAMEIFPFSISLGWLFILGDDHSLNLFLSFT
jgi:hypothetical protein